MCGYVRTRVVGVIASRQVSVIRDGRVSVIIGGRTITDKEIQIIVYGLLMCRGVHGKTINWDVGRTLMKDNRWWRHWRILLWGMD